MTPLQSISHEMGLPTVEDVSRLNKIEVEVSKRVTKNGHTEFVASIVTDDGYTITRFTLVPPEATTGMINLNRYIHDPEYTTYRVEKK